MSESRARGHTWPKTAIFLAITDAGDAEALEAGSGLVS